MHGREGSDVAMPGPYVDAAAQALREDLAVPDVELWVGAERGRALDRSGAIADVWLANGYFGEEALVRQLERLRAASRRPVRPAVRRDFLCDPDSNKTHATVRRMLADGYRGGKFDESLLIAGTPAECLERMSGIAGLGFEDVLLRPAADGPAAVEQFQMLFEEWDRLGTGSPPRPRPRHLKHSRWDPARRGDGSRSWVRDATCRTGARSPS
jgi:alkanesulfonate monooxygenase SsuD/methylene tetrahydromethanopterin reductase-like flavin-dependent oxidoreductase (luciferase family)